MPTGFQQCSHLCGRCRNGALPFELSTSGPWLLKDDIREVSCTACGARHSIVLTVGQDGHCHISTRPL